MPWSILLIISDEAPGVHTDCNFKLFAALKPDWGKYTSFSFCCRAWQTWRIVRALPGIRGRPAPRVPWPAGRARGRSGGLLCRDAWPPRDGPARPAREILLRGYANLPP